MEQIKPNFLIIGANKAGTTSLHEYLSQHPEICMSKIKEPMYFTRFIDSGGKSKSEKFTQSNLTTSFDGYINLFNCNKNASAFGESSTSYLANPECAKEIFQFNPQMKLISILRNPVTRAYSNFIMYKRWGFEHRSFEKAITDELKGYDSAFPVGRRYLYLSSYYQSLKMFLSVFRREQLHVVIFEDFIKSPHTEIKSIYDFLEVNNVEMSFYPESNSSKNFYYSFPFTYANRNKGVKRILDRMLPPFIKHKLTTVPVLSQKSVAFLNDYFKSEISNLSNLVSIDFNRWRKL